MPRRSPLSRFALGYGVFACVTLVLLVLLASFNFRRLLDQEVQTAMQGYNLQLKNHVASNLHAHALHVQDLRLGLAGLLAQGADPRIIRSYLSASEKNISDIALIYCTSNQKVAEGGFVYMSQDWASARRVLEIDNTRRPWFVSAKKAQGQVSFSAPYLDALSGRQVIDISANIYDTLGHDIGVLSVMLRVSDLSRMLGSEGEVPSEQAFLVDSAGRFVTHPDDAYIGFDLFKEMGLEHYRSSMLQEKPFAHLGDETYIYSTPILKTQDGPWYLVAVAPARSLTAIARAQLVGEFWQPALLAALVFLLLLFGFGRLFLLELQDKRRIERMGVTDPLTGISNRKNFLERFKLEWRRMAREKEPLGFLLIDIDRFKNFNAEHGHLQGDNLLVDFAQILKKQVRRPPDLVARLTGEEFGVLLPNTSAEGTRWIAEEIRAKIETALPITVSIGVAHCFPEHKSLSDTFFTAAEENLYQEKGVVQPKNQQPNQHPN
jgi:diguanylate cyclase (GGDEF)-like protein